MLKAIVLLLPILAILTDGVDSNGGKSRILSKYKSDCSSFLSGDLGFLNLNSHSIVEDDHHNLKQSAATTLRSILEQHMGFTGSEVIAPTSQSPDVDEQGNVHIRFKQYLGGFPIEGASMVMHVSGEDGSIFAINGEFHSDAKVETGRAKMSCETAVETAIKGRGILRAGRWESECAEAAVQGRDGNPHMAYKRLRGYQPRGGGPYQRDLVFASVETGKLLAVHPKVYGARALQTFECNETAMCSLLSDSPNKINSSDSIANRAHNNTIDAYDFYKLAFKRLSMDGRDATMKTYVQYEFNLSNSFFSPIGFDGTESPILVYGDGDGSRFTSFSNGLDIVVHEYSHGVTYFSSNLAYQCESGALNEAFSDIMGAAADRLLLGKSPQDVWQVGEDIVLHSGRDGAIRNLADPGANGNPDHYSVRYIGAEDHGGVHTNSAIVSMAFVLAVQGGIHPRSRIEVPALNSNFDLSIWYATQIFYYTNTLCLTEGADLLVARECTLMVISKTNVPSSYKTAWTNTFTKAWDAVGVRAIEPLLEGAPLSNLSLSLDGDVQVYRLQGTVPAGTSVTCTIAGANGDADLFVRFGRYPSVTPPTTFNDCWSMTIGTSMEQCTTRPALLDSTVYVAVGAFQAFDNATLQCSRQDAAIPACKQKGQRCTRRTECCSGGLACDGPTPATKKCKSCKPKGAACVRNSQCCSGLKCSGTCKAVK